MMEGIRSDYWPSRMKLNKQFYKSSDFMFAIYVALLQLAVLIHQFHRVSNSITNQASSLIWLSVAIMFLLKAIFTRRESVGKKDVSVSRRNFYWTIILMFGFEIIMFIFALNQSLVLHTAFSLYVGAGFFGISFGGYYYEQLASKPVDKLQQYTTMGLLAMFVMTLIPFILFSLVM